jgi:hypothetical protein
LNKSELTEFDIGELNIGDKVFLVRKITGDVITTEIDSYSRTGKETIEVTFNRRNKYKVFVTSGKVESLTGTQSSRQTVRAWYVLWESQRNPLIEKIREVRKGRRCG